MNFEKLVESNEQNKKTPDWKLETNKYIFLIEQKSALLPIDARTSDKEERFEKLENYLKNNIVKGFKQLNKYKINNNNKKIIRICLTLEKLYIGDNIIDIIEKDINFTFDKNMNWVISISEFEILIDLLKCNEEKFNEIIEKKLVLDIKEQRYKKNIENLLEGYKCDYIENKINYRDLILEEIIRDLKNN